jgi:hypothetical protein
MVKVLDGVIFIPFLLVGDATFIGSYRCMGKIVAFCPERQCRSERICQRLEKTVLDFGRSPQLSGAKLH